MLSCARSEKFRLELPGQVQPDCKFLLENSTPFFSSSISFDNAETKVAAVAFVS
jgi:hypothetical protein